MLLVILAPYFYDLFIPETANDLSAFKKEIDAFEKGIKEKNKHSYRNRLDQYIENRYDTLELFYFDPNVTKSESFKKLGLTDKQIATINNYRNKGGRFYVKDDFRKIYGIRNYQYLKLKPFILLADKITDKQAPRKRGQNQIGDSLFNFDPNTANTDAFIKLGLKERQIKTIKNYLDKGGSFQKKEDFKKIYGISNKQYQKLEPFIEIKKAQPDVVNNINYVELNSADYNELVKISGIGDYLAKAIIKYRDKLGGFTNKKQLLEIYNFRQSTFDKVSRQFTVDKSKTTKININFADYEELAKHPYISYKQAKAIEHYRANNGPFKTINIILAQKILPSTTFNKIKPYLVVK